MKEKDLNTLVAEYVFNMPVKFVDAAWDDDDWLGDGGPTKRNCWAFMCVNFDGDTYYRVIPDYANNGAHIFDIIAALSYKIPSCSLFIRYDRFRKSKQWTVMVGDNGRIDCDYEDIARIVCETAVNLARK